MKILFGNALWEDLEREKLERVLPSATRLGCFDSDSLCAWQAQLQRRGIEGARLIETVYGWSVRDDSGLNNFALLAGKRMGNIDGSRESAETFAREWVAARPDRRYVWE